MEKRKYKKDYYNNRSEIIKECKENLIFLVGKLPGDAQKIEVEFIGLLQLIEEEIQELRDVAFDIAHTKAIEKTGEDPFSPPEAGSVMELIFPVEKKDKDEEKKEKNESMFR